tara:strand:- start:153 stop:446 length:294 start_codon:yes stop_codon:yes gene_type:complete
MSQHTNGKYGCLYPDCRHSYLTTDGLRKHANKKHPEWIKNKKPSEYAFHIPQEYRGEDYVRDYMIMVRHVLNDKYNTVPEHNQVGSFFSELQCLETL